MDAVLAFLKIFSEWPDDRCQIMKHMHLLLCVFMEQIK
jgi:hypothetical protein